MNLVLGAKASWPKEIDHLAKCLTSGNIRAVEHQQFIADDVIELLIRVEQLVLRKIHRVDIIVIQFYRFNTLLENSNRQGDLFKNAQEDISDAIGKGVCYFGGVTRGYVFQSLGKLVPGNLLRDPKFLNEFVRPPQTQTGW